MDNKKQLKIPGYIWWLAFVVILCFIYLFVVQIPFMQAKPGLETEHASAQSQIAIYQEYTNNAATYQAKINNMIAEYEAKSEILFVNASKTREEIYNMINTLQYSPTTISVSDQQLDPQGRASSSGEPLYTTTIVLTMRVSKEVMFETLDYFEGNLGTDSADGTYYISNVNFQQVTEGEGDDIVKKDEYDVTIQMDMFFFNPQTSTAVTNESSATS